MKYFIPLCAALFITLFALMAYAAPVSTIMRNILPEADSTYELGTSTKAWLYLYTDNLCLNGDCRSSWPASSGGSGNVSTSSVPVIGQLAYWTTTTATPALLSTVATTSLTINAPLTTAGTAGALVGGTALTLDIDDIKAADLDLTDITLNDFTNDAGFLTTVDISANTNLAATYPLLLTGDTLSIAFGTTTANSWSALQTFVNASTTLGTLGTTWFSGISNAVLGADNNGLAVATSVISTSLLSGSLGTINSTAFNRGGTITVTAASSTALSDRNTWSALNLFSNSTSTLGTVTTLWSTNANLTNASSTLLTNSGSVWLTGVTASRPLYVDSAGLVGSAGSGTSGNCVQWGADNTLADAGSACGTGGGTYPWDKVVNFGTTTQATTTPTWFKMGLHASSTSEMENLNVWNALRLTATTSSILATDQSGYVVATTSINAAYITGQLGTVNTTYPLAGGGAFSRGGTLTLTTAATSTLYGNLVSSILSVNDTGTVVATTSINAGYISGQLGTINGTALSRGGSITINALPWTTKTTNFATSTQATTTPFWFQMGLHASSTSEVVNLDVWQALRLTATTSSVLATDQNGYVLASTTIGWNLLKGPASTIFAFNESGVPTATTSVGWNYIKGPLSSIFAFNESGTPIATTSIGRNYIKGSPSSIFGFNESGTAVSTSSIGWNYIKGSPSSIFAFDSSGVAVATSAINVGYLTGTLPIAKGGTNASSIGNNMVLAMNGTSVVSTSTPTVAAFFATSTTATSTIVNALEIGTTTGNFGSLIIGNASRPQIILSDNSSSNPLWAFRTKGTVLYISTSTAAATSSIPAMQIDGDGAAGILVGTTSNSNAILATVGRVYMDSLTTESGAGNVLCVKTNTEVVQDDSPLTACSGASSIKVKNIVELLDSEKSLDMILHMKPVAYRFKESYKPNDSSVHLGFIAEDVEALEPRLVEEAEQDLLGLKYVEMVSPIISAIQGQQKQIENLTIGKVRRTAEENWQWMCLGLLSLVVMYQQHQIRRLKRGL